ncbi:hypothetical protein F5888DRAFT_1632597 [Russula emetica]|nr:hypothetical protein F5888DRAFT_1632597 [Russula emetica]
MPLVSAAALWRIVIPLANSKPLGLVVRYYCMPNVSLLLCLRRRIDGFYGYGIYSIASLDTAWMLRCPYVALSTREENVSTEGKGLRERSAHIPVTQESRRRSMASDRARARARTILSAWEGGLEACLGTRGGLNQSTYTCGINACINIHNQKRGVRIIWQRGARFRGHRSFSASALPWSAGVSVTTPAVGQI